MKLKIAVMSATGTAKKRTIPVLEKSSTVEIKAVHSRSERKLEELKARWPYLETFTNPQEMISKSNPDIVFIGSPPFLHKDQIALAAQRGKHIICEKPLSLTIQDALEISKIVDDSGIRFTLAHHVRHQKAIVDIRKMLTEETFGKIRSARFQWSFPISFSSPSSEWKFDPKNKLIHSFFDAGVHMIDLAIYFWGMPKGLSARGFKHLGKDMYDTVSCDLFYEEHVVTLFCSLSQAAVGNDIQIWTEKGYLHAKDAFSEKSIRRITIQEAESFADIDYEQTNLYAVEVEDFAKSIEKSSGYIGTTLSEAIMSMNIMDAISKSLVSGKPVDIQEALLK